MLANLRMFVDEAPRVEHRDDGYFHVIDRSGRTVIDRAKSPNSLFLYLVAGRRALIDWQVRYGPVPDEEEPGPPAPDNLDLLEIFIDGPPHIFPGDDRHIHIVDRSGEVVMERVMSAHNFALYLERGELAQAEWTRRQSGG